MSSQKANLLGMLQVGDKVRLMMISLELRLFCAAESRCTFSYSWWIAFSAAQWLSYPR